MNRRQKKERDQVSRNHFCNDLNIRNSRKIVIIFLMDAH